MVVLVMATSSSRAHPCSRARSRASLEDAVGDATLMKPPFDSVPHLMRPYGNVELGANFLNVPSRTEPSS